MENIAVAVKRINAIIQTCNNTNMFILQSCHARIEEFLSGEGSNFPKIFDKKKKKKRTEKRGFGCSSSFILQKYGLKRLSIQVNCR